MILNDESRQNIKLENTFLKKEFTLLSYITFCPKFPSPDSS